VSRRNPGFKMENQWVLFIAYYYSNCRLMLDNIIRNIQKKSPKAISSRYRSLFFLLYFVLGLFNIFMKKFPLDSARIIRFTLDYY
jgi:hypothetical protein